MTSGKLPEGVKAAFLERQGFGMTYEQERDVLLALPAIEADIRNRVLGDGVDWRSVHAEADSLCPQTDHPCVKCCARSALDSAGIGEER